MARAVLSGMPVSPGIAIGPLLLLPDSRIYEKRQLADSEIESEVASLKAASKEECEALEKTLQAVPENLAEYRDMISSQMELARDPRILNGAEARIRHKKICAPWALSETIAELCAIFEGMADPYLSDRAQDIRAVCKSLMGGLTGFNSTIKKGGAVILAAYDLSPADVMEFRLNDGIDGIITVEGGATSHTAILARGLKVPAIAGATGLFEEARNGETIILDGLAGRAIIGPDAADISRYKNIRQKYADFEHEAQQAADSPAVTKNGVGIAVQANLESQQEIGEYLRSGAEGIGLYRTEFAYLSGSLPTEETLFQEYSTLLKASGRKRVIFRTLDAGADKILPAHEALQEPNPALGLRGVRFCLQHPEIFHPQLRAILRAGANANMALMLPMITSIQEVREVKGIIASISADLASQGIAHASRPPIGIMVETPAAALVCDELAQEVDFLSLGTNDLLHYLMAIDRNNRHVSYLHNPLHPAFIRAIKQVTDAAHRRHKSVCVCGELAADPMGLALLLGLGVDSFSATPRFVPTVKHLLRQLDSNACAEIAARALAGCDMNETRQLLRNTLVSCMDSELVFPHALTGPAPTA